MLATAVAYSVAGSSMPNAAQATRLVSAPATRSMRSVRASSLAGGQSCTVARRRRQSIQESRSLSITAWTSPLASESSGFASMSAYSCA